MEIITGCQRSSPSRVVHSRTLQHRYQKTTRFPLKMHHGSRMQQCLHDDLVNDDVECSSHCHCRADKHQHHDLDEHSSRLCASTHVNLTYSNTMQPITSTPRRRRAVRMHDDVDDDDDDVDDDDGDDDFALLASPI